MHSAAKSVTNVVYKEPLFVDEHQSFMTIFIREAPIAEWIVENTALECIRTVAATYGCKILQLYEYKANDTPRISAHAA